MTVMRIVNVQTGSEVSRAELADDGTVTYHGGQTAAATVRTRMRDYGETEAAAVANLLRAGWSNGYLMVALPDLHP
ncbi:hypothetical protein ACFYY8_31575 [Streptosporangium sp. NPDC001559]|uniref:hypothetical protein n=1 Tax=Streptosporangium sp. NPDC001559 TaxID=3366187 RepID=UPI0036E7FDEB